MYKINFNFGNHDEDYFINLFNEWRVKKYAMMSMKDYQIMIHKDADIILKEFSEYLKVLERPEKIKNIFYEP